MNTTNSTKNFGNSKLYDSNYNKIFYYRKANALIYEMTLCADRKGYIIFSMSSACEIFVLQVHLHNFSINDRSIIGHVSKHDTPNIATQFRITRHG